MLEAPAKTPAAYLDLLCEGQVLADVSCISHSFARADCVELLAFRTEAPKLLAFLKLGSPCSGTLFPFLLQGPLLN